MRLFHIIVLGTTLAVAGCGSREKQPANQPDNVKPPKPPAGSGSGTNPENNPMTSEPQKGNTP